VKTYETDFQQYWKPTCFFQAMQEAALHHAAALGFGYEEMLSKNMVWILSRVRIRFLAFPRLGDRVRIETWPKGIQQRLLFMRDFYLTDSAGARLAEASTAWLLVDPRARRILPPQALAGTLPDNGGRAAIAEPLEKLNPPDGLPETLTRSAGYSTIDLMGHVTSSRYLEWIADTFSLEDHSTRRLTDLQINYTHEVKPGESVSLASGPDGSAPSRWWVQGTNHATGLRAFEAVLKFGVKHNTSRI
jgi:medium-chain acyl-[acyl-carrier-protein] hydrolase